MSTHIESRGSKERHHIHLNILEKIEYIFLRLLDSAYFILGHLQERTRLLVGLLDLMQEQNVLTQLILSLLNALEQPLKLGLVVVEVTLELIQ